MKWRERLRQEPQWQDIRQWPLADLQRLPPPIRKKYQQNFASVAKALAGESLKAIAKGQQIHPSQLTRLLNRCLGGDPASPPPLSAGLIPYRRVQENRRSQPLGSVTDSVGPACSFQYLLDTVPGLKHHLDKLIEKHVKQARRGQNLSPKTFHDTFIRYLESHQWPRDKYPYTGSSRAYESARKYLVKTTAEFRMPREPTRVVIAREVPKRMYSEIHIDEYTVDCHGAAAIVLDDQMEVLRLSRITLLLARDVATGSHLARAIALTKNPSADDLLGLFDQITRPWQPLSLTTPGLKYSPGACFPSSIHPDFCRVTLGVIRLDNALMHLAHNVRSYVCDELGATINFGLPKQPKTRNVIEQAFAHLNVDLHRFPSTTGSSVVDPVREPLKHRGKPPYISLRALEEVIDVLLTEHNVRPLGNQGAISPLDQARYQLANLMIPLRPPSPVSGLSPFQGRQTVTVRKSKGDLHAPHINFEKVAYRGAAINKAELVNKPVQIVFDRRDLRRLMVLTADGQPLGEVLAPRTWQRFAHSLATRKHINSLIRENLITRNDPLGNYFEYTLSHRALPSSALDLVRVSREFGSELPAGEQTTEIDTSVNTAEQKGDQEATVPLHDDRAVETALKKVPDWSPAMVKDRR